MPYSSGSWASFGAGIHHRQPVGGFTGAALEYRDSVGARRSVEQRASGAGLLVGVDLRVDPAVLEGSDEVRAPQFHSLTAARNQVGAVR